MTREVSSGQTGGWWAGFCVDQGGSIMMLYRLSVGEKMMNKNK
jgi:hypothetical protein